MVIIKSESEIEKLRKSNSIVAEVLATYREVVKPGITTMYLNDIGEEILKKYGATPGFKGYRGFPYSLCASVNEGIVHGFPNNKKLKSGDIVSLDFGSFIDGFYGDAAITLPVGKISDKVSKLISTTEECLYKGIAMAIGGNYVSDISNAIYSHATKNGFEVIREFVGHGLGRELHEEPQVLNYGSPGRGVKLKPGMVICIEPMLVMGSNKISVAEDGWQVSTADKSFAAHFEHAIAITKNDPEILSKY